LIALLQFKFNRCARIAAGAAYFPPQGATLLDHVKYSIHMIMAPDGSESMGLLALNSNLEKYAH